MLAFYFCSGGRDLVEYQADSPDFTPEFVLGAGEKCILLAEPLTQLRFSPPWDVFQPPPGCSPVPDSELDVAGEAGQLEGEVRDTVGVCSCLAGLVLTETTSTWKSWVQVRGLA